MGPVRRIQPGLAPLAQPLADVPTAFKLRPEGWMRVVTAAGSGRIRSRRKRRQPDDALVQLPSWRGCCCRAAPSPPDYGLLAPSSTSLGPPHHTAQARQTSCPEHRLDCSSRQVAQHRVRHGQPTRAPTRLGPTETWVGEPEAWIHTGDRIIYLRDPLFSRLYHLVIPKRSRACYRDGVSPPTWVVSSVV